VKRYESEADKKLLETPDINKYVFCQVLADCGQVRQQQQPHHVGVVGGIMPLCRVASTSNGHISCATAVGLAWRVGVLA
jgi:hypothetical protein